MADWKIIAASATGTRHRETAHGCQDAHAFVCVTTDFGDVLVAAVSDGAGSAPRSAEGARLACEQFVVEARELLEAARSIDEFASESIVKAWAHVQATLADHAATEGIPLETLACTLITVISFPALTLVAQLGDGAVVVGHGGHMTVPVWPQNGEFANETYFLTQSAWREQLDIKAIEGPAEWLCVFTDGLQNLILRLADRAAEPRFLNPIIAALRSDAPTDELHDQLVEFLNSERVVSRTDDDKTLLLAVHTGRASE